MCIDGAFEIEYNKDLYQYKRRYGSNPSGNYYVIKSFYFRNLYFIVGNRNYMYTQIKIKKNGKY
jgi:hypothetical protein